MARGGFRGGYGGMNQANVMKQAQKMQQDFLRMQKELEEKEFTAKSGGGMVSATVNGNREVTKIEIKPGSGRSRRRRDARGSGAGSRQRGAAPV